MPIRLPHIASSYSWLREAFHIVFLSKNFPWQDLRHSKLDDDRCNDCMDHHFRVSAYFSMWDESRRLLGNYPRVHQVLQRRQCPTSWILCNRCRCRSCLIGATYANSQYTFILLHTRSNYYQRYGDCKCQSGENLPSLECYFSAQC